MKSRERKPEREATERGVERWREDGEKKERETALNSAG